MNLYNIFKAGGSGILLGVATAVLTGFGGYFAFRISREKRPVVGFAEGSTAGNAVGTPAAIAAIDKSMAPIMAVATAQVAAACIVTAFLCPLMVVMADKHFKKKESAKLAKQNVQA